MDGMGLAEAMLLKNNDGFCGGNSCWIWILFLLFFVFGGGNFFGGRGNELQSYATQQDIQRGFDTNAVTNKLNGLESGLCDSTFALNNSINSVGTILGSKIDNCCCENRLATCNQTNELSRAIHAEGEATRALINSNVMQELRDQLQAAQLTLSNANQTQSIIGALNPAPKPAYITCSPYAATFNPYVYGAGCSC